MFTRESMLAQEPGEQPEGPTLDEDRVEATRAVVLLVEEDAHLRRQLLQAIPADGGRSGLSRPGRARRRQIPAGQPCGARSRPVPGHRGDTREGGRPPKSHTRGGGRPRGGAPVGQAHEPGPALRGQRRHRAVATLARSWPALWANSPTGWTKSWPLLPPRHEPGTADAVKPS